MGVARSMSFLRAGLVGAATFTVSLAPAQTPRVTPAAPAATPGRLTVSPNTYRTLVQAGTKITAAMCQAADTYCQQQLVGQQLLNNVTATTSDSLGNIYGADEAFGIVVKISPSGAPLIVAGKYNHQVDGVAAGTPAIKIGLQAPVGLTVDPAGNLYIADSLLLVKVDVLGIATPVTQSSYPSSTNDGGAASGQYVHPTSLASDGSGNIFLVDGNACTVREYAPRTGTMTIVAGDAATGCQGMSAPTTGQPAKGQAIHPAGVAVGSDGTLYFSDSMYGVYSVDHTGTLQLIAPAGNTISAGPTGNGGSVGTPGALNVDAAGNIYVQSSTTQQNNQSAFALLEVSEGTSNSPSQVIILAGNYVGSQAVNEGYPSTLAGIANFFGNFAMDPFGRLILPSASSVVSLSRDGSLVFSPVNTYSQETLTYTNAGGSTLHGVPFGGTPYPYLLGPTDADIARNGESGKQPFSVFEGAGSCLAKFASGTFTLDPGESCTLVIEYAPNGNVPPAGVITFFTDDPLGPVSVSLSATQVYPGAGNAAPTLSSSLVKVAGNATANAAGNFTFNIAVSSTVADGNGGTASVTPSGPLVFGLVNSANGVHSPEELLMLDGSGRATVTFNGVPRGTYEAYAVYLGYGNAPPSYSPAQTELVRQPIDFTTFADTQTLHYEGASAQFLNFSGPFYTLPGVVEAQDFEAGVSGVSFVLTDDNGSAVDTSSATPLNKGTYTVTPVVANAAALDYSVTTHAMKLRLLAADLTVRDLRTTSRYGQYLTSGTPTATEFTISNGVRVTNESFIQADLASGAIALTTSVSNAGQDPTTHLLPVGTYTISTALSGAGAGNYSLTDHANVLQVNKADLTLALNNVSSAAGSATPVSSFCQVRCYTLPNTTLLNGDQGLGISFVITQPSQPGFSMTVDYNHGNGSIPALPAGTYTVTPTTRPGGTSPDYSLTARAATLKVTP